MLTITGAYPGGSSEGLGPPGHKRGAKNKKERKGKEKERIKRERKKKRKKKIK